MKRYEYIAPECDGVWVMVPAVLCASPDEGCIEGLEIEDWVTGE